MKKSVKVNFENGEPASITTIHYDNIEKLFGTETAQKIKNHMEKQKIK